MILLFKNNYQYFNNLTGLTVYRKKKEKHCFFSGTDLWTNLIKLMVYYLRYTTKFLKLWATITGDPRILQGGHEIVA